jgi:hypothetical protein
MRERRIMSKLVLATMAVAAVCLAGDASAKGPRVKAVAAPVVLAVPAQDCSVFYDDNHVRGFGWGSGGGSSLGFGTFEGALPRYPDNSFPNWYGACVTWGRYSATGSARW